MLEIRESQITMQHPHHIISYHVNNKREPNYNATLISHHVNNKREYKVNEIYIANQIIAPNHCTRNHCTKDNTIQYNTNIITREIICISCQCEEKEPSEISVYFCLCIPRCRWTLFYVVLSIDSIAKD